MAMAAGSNQLQSVEVLLVGDDHMKELNKTTFGKNDTTDVISYPVDKDKGLLGQLVVNVDEVRRNAERFGTKYELELARVVAHGTLHLLGYTDDTEDSRMVMKALEDAVISDYDLGESGKLALQVKRKERE